MPLDADADLRALLSATKTIAMVGASDNPSRDSNRVMRFLQGQGYKVIPVNPVLAGTMLNGEPVVACLADIAEPVDMVDVFRRADAVLPIVADAIAIGAKAVWMQLGIVHAEAAAAAEAAGLVVVMDRCPKQEIPRLGLLRAV
jgi:predicted CoA-binding protein